jgi:hypothetical protein
VFVDPGRSRCVPVNQVNRAIDNGKVVFVVQDSLSTGVGSIHLFPEGHIGRNGPVQWEGAAGMGHALARQKKRDKKEKEDEEPAKKSYDSGYCLHHANVLNLLVMKRRGKERFPAPPFADIFCESPVIFAFKESGLHFLLSRCAGMGAGSSDQGCI